MAYTRINWKDAPSTDTLVNAENLNHMDKGIYNLDNVTKYITATATTNGDFDVPLGITAYTGMIVYVNFPNATSDTSNARLSIDGGGTYVNIKYENGVQAIASDIQNVDYEIKYNGTDFLTINSKEKVLYNNPSGTTGTVNLSETADNFKYIEISYRSLFEVHNSVKIYNPNNKIFAMQCVWWRGEENKILAYVAQGLVFKTTITISHSGEFNIFVSSANGTANAGIFITKVVGYRA